MPGIFISYRRDDSIGHTGRLYDLLSQHFGRAHVFMDIDTIGPGENFAEVIEKTCDTCEVLLAVIGHSWATVTGQNGIRRLDDPEDFVRLEIGHALEKGLRVVPVLVDGAQMPDAKTLPPDLKNLALRNAWEINYKRFHHDVGQLVEALEKMQPALQALRSQSEAGPQSLKTPVPRAEEQHLRPANTIRKGIYAGFGAVVVFVVALAAYQMWFKSSPGTPPTGPAQTEPRGAYDIPSLQANITGPVLFFLFAPGQPLPPAGQRPYATSFSSAASSGKQIFWEIALDFKGQFPPPDYQIESVWYRDSKEVFRRVGDYKGSMTSSRAYHNRFAWSPPEGRLLVGQYRVDFYVAGRQVTSGNFAVQP